VEHQLKNNSVSGPFLSDEGLGDEPVAVPITNVFDLHAFAPRDVKSAVEAYLEEAHSLGLTALRIIHGRGIGVQRETVRKVLARTPFVLSYSDAPAEAGGWGATIVTLAPLDSL
jgi:dsDNA-specific endonuclease/ATPase MutS2